MTKKEYFFIYMLALFVLSTNFIFQKTPGYLDSQYYFLGGKEIAKGTLTAPVIWNYLDEPAFLPHSLFTYWMPLPSIFVAAPLRLLNSGSFFAGRLLFWLIGSLIAPLTALMSMKWTKNIFSARVAALLAIFSGLYFKFITIPETVTLYILFGGMYFYVLYSLIFESPQKEEKFRVFLLGIFAGLLHLTRVDGIVLFFIAIGAFLIIGRLVKNKYSISTKQLFDRIVLVTLGYLLIMSPWYLRTYTLFGTLFSPASSRALWISEYNDSFAFPVSQLTLQYWLQYGWPLKFSQIFSALKLNVGNLVAVQFGFVGLPLGVWSIYRQKTSKKLLIPLIYFLITFFLMTFVFSLAGERGGYLHAMAAIQIIFWILIADGLNHFIQWGIDRRNWKLTRSRWMFGSALVGFAIILTGLFYVRDVTRFQLSPTNWDAESVEFKLIENAIGPQIPKNKVMLINNPPGYFLASDRWSIVIPDADWQNLKVLIQKFDVKYVVLDDNLPASISNREKWISTFQLEQLLHTDGGKTLYELP